MLERCDVVVVDLQVSVAVAIGISEQVDTCAGSVQPPPHAVDGRGVVAPDQVVARQAQGGQVDLVTACEIRPGREGEDVVDMTVVKAAVAAVVKTAAAKAAVVYRRFGRRLVDVTVIANATVKRVGTEPTDDGVVTTFAKDLVVATAAVDGIRTAHGTDAAIAVNLV